MFEILIFKLSRVISLSFSDVNKKEDCQQENFTNEYLTSEEVDSRVNKIYTSKTLDKVFKILSCFLLTMSIILLFLKKAYALVDLDNDKHNLRKLSESQPSIDPEITNIID